MARIARRSLRIRGVPLFSLGQPWQSVCDDGGSLTLRLYEPRYVELARRVFPPGDGKFGYAETYPPKARSAGVLANVEAFQWASSAEAEARGEKQEVALLQARAARRFRILSVKEEEIKAGQSPLYVAHVQLLADRDVARGPGTDALDYWTRPAGGGGEAAGASRASCVKAGTVLAARQGAPVFEHTQSWSVVGSMPVGAAAVATGPPETVEGYLMVPIAPSGAVELTLFRNLDDSPQDAEARRPTEEQLRATLLNLGKVPSEPTSETSESRAADSLLGRKSRRRRGI